MHTYAVSLFNTLLRDDKNKLYGYERQHQGQRVWVLFNNGDQEQQLSVANPDAINLLRY